MTDKLRAEAASGPWTLMDLQRQYAYDQLIERLYRIDDKWVVKGATALLARRISVRHTIDIYLYRTGAINEVERLLREASTLDIGDWMHFEVGASVRIQASGAQGVRTRIRSFIGSKAWATFQADLVADGVLMSAEPDVVLPLTSVNIGNQMRTEWKAYPLVDHIADKICAILERHGGVSSTRYKDLVDLVAIIQRSEVLAKPQIIALSKEAERRDLALPREFDVPDHELWRIGYQAESRRTVGLSASRLDEALALVSPFIDPLLVGTATGRWEPRALSWFSEGIP
ncbi:MAG: nucleotidyl transferase AbiEii/AbiGii toxin family protein [Propionibacterium sp.]|nr:nucleotidyl transferase AbiEii/AbiGii toxin family protein [Propionibacterium sp.]